MLTDPVYNFFYILPEMIILNIKSIKFQGLYLDIFVQIEVFSPKKGRFLTAVTYSTKRVKTRPRFRRWVAMYFLLRRTHVRTSKIVPHTPRFLGDRTLNLS